MEETTWSSGNTPYPPPRPDEYSDPVSVQQVTVAYTSMPDGSNSTFIQQAELLFRPDPLAVARFLPRQARDVLRQLNRMTQQGLNALRGWVPRLTGRHLLTFDDAQQPGRSAGQRNAVKSKDGHGSRPSKSSGTESPANAAEGKDSGSKAMLSEDKDKSSKTGSSKGQASKGQDSESKGGSKGPSGMHTSSSSNMVPRPCTPPELHVQATVQRHGMRLPRAAAALACTRVELSLAPWDDDATQGEHAAAFAVGAVCTSLHRLVPAEWHLCMMMTRLGTCCVAEKACEFTTVEHSDSTCVRFSLASSLATG